MRHIRISPQVGALTRSDNKKGYMEKKDATIEIIDNYDRLPLKKYKEIADIVNNSPLDDLDRQVAIVSVLSGMSTQKVLALDLATFSALSLRTTFLNREAKAGSVAESYRLGGLELVRVKDFRSLTAGQYIDFQRYCKNGADLVDLLSVILIPEGHRYSDGYDMYKVRSAINNHLTIPQVLGLQDFFFRSSQRLIESSLSSWEAAIRKMSGTKRKETMKELQRIQASVPAGVGSASSTSSAKPHGKTGTRSLKWRPWSSFRSWLTGKTRTTTKRKG